MIHPDMVANPPGIELESGFPTPEIPTPDKQPDIMTQLAAARLNAGLDEEHKANIETRGVIKTTDMRSSSVGILIRSLGLKE